MKGLYGCILLISLFTYSSSAQVVTSAQSGPWNDPQTWSPQTVPTNANSSSILINSGHIVNYNVSGTVDQVTVSGTLTVDGGITLTLANGAGNEITVNPGGELTNNGIIAFGGIPNRVVLVNGVVNNNGTFNGVSAAKLTFGPNSSYNHQFENGGVIPAATWNITSTVNIVGYTSGNDTPPEGLNQQFGNLVWNAPGQDVTIVLNSIEENQPLNISINGDFRVESTGGDALYYSAGGPGGTANIGGDLAVAGGVLGWTTGDSGPSTINIGGNLEITSGGYFQIGDDVNVTVNIAGGFVLSDDGMVDFAASGAVTNLNIQGNYTHTSGEMYVNGGTGNVNFIGASTKVFESVIEPQGPVNYSVASLSTLDMIGESFVGGSGNFTLNGTMRLGSLHPGGALQSGGLAGNLRITGTRNHATGATIVYAGEGPQFIGSGFPSGSDVNLTIDNESGVTLSTSLDIVALRQLNLVSGNIVIGTQTLTINGTVAGTGGIIGGPTSKMVIGGTGNFGTLTFNGTSELEDFTFNRTGNGIVTLGGDLRILDTFTHSDGTLVIGANTLHISGNYGATNGILSVTQQSTILIDGEGTLPGDVSFTGSDLGTLTLNRANATLPMTSSVAIHNLELFGGTLDNSNGLSIAASGTIYRSAGGSMTTSPNNTTVPYNVVYQNGTMTTGPELPSNTTALQNLSKSGGNTLTLGSDITVNGTLSLANGSFAAGSNSIDLKGNFVSGSGSTLTGATVIFSGTTIISGGASPTFGNVVLSGTVTPNVNYRINGNLDNTGVLNAGTGNATFGGSPTVISGGSNSFNTLIIAGGGSLTAPPGSISVAGNFQNSGTFTHNGGTVEFNGTSSITGTSPTFNNITVTGALNSPANLILAGNLNINGTFTPGSNNITFTGGAPQRLDRTAGSGAAVVDLYNVTISKSSNTFSVASTIPNTTFRIANRFEITQNGSSGTDVDFDGPSNTGTLVLASTASRTAYIPPVPFGTSVVGNLTVERYIPNAEGIRSYRYFAPSVAGSNVADWQEEIAITGQFSNPTSIGNPSSPSMYQYAENIGGPWGDRYQAYPNNVALPANSFPLESGRGYAVYMYNAGTTTINTRGTLRTGDVAVGLTATGAEENATGYNLLGNPYPAPIDWDLVSLPSGVSATISIKDNVDNGGAGAGNFVYYVQGGPDVGNFDGVIASGQAFWTYTTENTTLTFSEAHKVSDINPVLLREKALANVLRINLRGNGRQDETVIWLQDEATDEVDLRFDATKKTNDFLNLYSLVEGSAAKFAINGLNDFGCSKAFKLGISQINRDSANIVSPGMYTLNFTQFESFGTVYDFSLVDKFSNEVVDVRSKPEYTFEINADPKSFGEGRFELLVSQPSFARDNVLHYNDVCEDAQAGITIEGTHPNVSYFVRDDNGQTISDVVMGNGNALVLNVEGSKLSSGLNRLMVYAASGSCEALPLEQTVDLRVTTVYNEFTAEDAQSCGTGNVVLSASGVPSEVAFYWYETETSVEPVSVGAVFETPVLERSKTYFVAARNALGCEGSRKEVTANVSHIEQAEISLLDGNVLSANYADNVQWYLDDQLIPGAVEQQFIAEQGGTYKVVAAVGGCEMSAYYNFAVTGLEERFEASIDVYPNPATDRVIVELRNTDPATAVLINSVGKPVGTADFVAGDGIQKAQFDITNASAGLYLLKIRQGVKSIYYKIIKE